MRNPATDRAAMARRQPREPLIQSIGPWIGPRWPDGLNGRFEPGRMERIDEPAYSPLAFREAIANAICHRDYATGGSSIGVAMYDDRLEVTSSGIFTSASRRRHSSSLTSPGPWNPLIASVFYRRGIIETWGDRG